MRAFQVHLNKKRLCLAGIGDDGVMSAILSHLSKGDEVDFRVGGLDSSTDEHVIWKELKLYTGDEIRIKIVESRVVDKPRVRSPRDRAQEKRYRKLHVRRMAKELGWKIIAPKKAPLQ
jgi:hypothetical protein